MPNPFDFVTDILQKNEGLMIDEQSEKEYAPFIVNRAISYHLDCVMFANEMNQRPLLDKKMQYSYFMKVIRKYKRPFQKWIKREEPEDIDVVKKAFSFSNKKAKAALLILTPKQLEELKEKQEIGGLKKSK